MIREFFYQQGDGIVQGCMYKRKLIKISNVISENKIEWHRGLKDRHDSYSLIEGEKAELLEIGFKAGANVLIDLFSEEFL